MKYFSLPFYVLWWSQLCAAQISLRKACYPAVRNIIIRWFQLPATSESTQRLLCSCLCVFQGCLHQRLKAGGVQRSGPCNSAWNPLVDTPFQSLLFNYAWFFNFFCPFMFPPCYGLNCPRALQIYMLKPQPPR